MNIRQKLKFLFELLNFNYSSYAASISFYAILSIFPFCILLLTFLFIFYRTDNIDSMLQILSKYLTSYGIDLIRKEIYHSFHQFSTHASILSLIALVWSSTNLYSSLESGLNAVNEVKSGRSILRSKLISLIIVVVFIPSLLIVAQVHLFYQKMWKQIGIENHFLVLLIRIIIISLSLFALHSLAYVFIPYKKISISSTINGTLFSTIIWVIVSISFDWYIKNYSSYSKIYGSLATIIIFLFYIYIIATFFLIGARINHLKERNLAPGS